MRDRMAKTPPLSQKALFLAFFFLILAAPESISSSNPSLQDANDQSHINSGSDGSTPEDIGGRILGHDNQLRSVKRRPGEDYETIYPEINQLLPGSFNATKPDETLIQEVISSIEAETKKYTLKSDKIAKIVEDIKGGQIKQFISELVSELKEMTTAAAGAAESSRKIAFIGPQSAGKSFVENLMTLLGLGVSSAVLGTKTLVHYELRRTDQERYTIGGRSVPYEELNSELKKRFESMMEVENIKIVVQIHAPWVPFQADYLDVPGIPQKELLKHRKNVVFEIIRELAASRENIDFVVVGDANVDPETVSDSFMSILKDNGVTNDRIIPVLNKVGQLIDNHNSGDENRLRINAWAEWFGQQPYLFAAGKKEEFDTIIDLGPREQTERWATAVNEGDKKIKEYVKQELADYPAHLIGVEQAVKMIKTKVVNDIMKVAYDYINSLHQLHQNEQPIEDNSERIINERMLQDAFTTFRNGVPELLKEIAGRENSWPLRVRDSGGSAFFETPDETDSRNTEALKRFAHAPKNLLEPKEKREVVVSSYKDAIDPSFGYFGDSIMKNDFDRHRTALLSWFITFEDEDLQYFIPSPERDPVQGYNKAIINAIAHLAKQLNIVGYLKDVICRMACDTRRIYRVTFWTFLDKHKHNKAMKVLFGSPEFRNKLQNVFDEELESLVVDSQKHMERIFGEIIDARLNGIQPKIYYQELITAFPDLKDKIVDMNKAPSPIPVDTHPDQEMPATTWEETYEYMRKAIKTYFSLRMLRAVEAFSNHIDSTWLNFDRLLNRWKEKFELGQESVVKAFNLDSAVKVLTRKEEAEAGRKAAIIKAMSVVANNKDMLKKVFDEYNPVRDFSFPKNE